MSHISHHSSNSSALQSNLKKMSSLLQFQLTPEQLAPVYHDAIQLPQFLTVNLRAKDRRVKQLNGENAILTAFYYSLLRLAFDLEDGKEVAERTRRMLTGDQQFGDGELQDKNLSDNQYRQFLAEFMDFLEKQGPLEEAIKPYPIIDTILLKMFQRMVPVTLLLRDKDDQRVAERVLSFLAHKFGMNLHAVGGCFKLVQADMFIYVQNMTEVYLVYVEELEGIRQESQNESQASDSIRRDSISTYKSNTSKIPIKDTAEKSQTVINILQSNKSMGQRSNNDKRGSFGSNSTVKMDRIKENISQQEVPKADSHSIQGDYSKMSFLSYNFSSNSALSTPIKKSPRTSETVKMMKTYDCKPPYRQQFSKFSSQIYSHAKPSNLAIFSTFSPGQLPSKQSILQSQESICQDSGYMKFTQGGVLQLLDQQFRQEIKMIKKKYRAERSSFKAYF